MNRSRKISIAPTTRPVCTIGLVALVLAVASPRLPADIVLNSRLSSAGVLANAGSNEDRPPLLQQTDFLPADLSVTATATQDDASASSSASLHSDITLDSVAGTLRLTGDGTTTGDSTFGSTMMLSSNTQADVSVLVLDFTLTDVSYTYTLTGQVSSTTDDGQYNGLARASLTSSTTIFEVFVLTNDGASESKPLSEKGTLSPGTYSFGVFASGGAPAPFSELPHSKGNANANFVLMLVPVGAPTPTPTPIQWDNPVGGSFQTAANWDPQTVPGSGDTAVFGLQTVYSVDVGTAATERLEIRNGDVTFTNANYAVGSTVFTPSGTVLDNSLLTLASGTLSGIHMLIGESAAARVNVFVGATLNYTGSIQVGGPGEGILHVENGGMVFSGEGRIGTGVGGGTAQLDGVGTLWDSGSLSVGFFGGMESNLFVTGGANVLSDTGSIGFGAGSDGFVQIKDANSLWSLSGPLTIGEGGVGGLDLLDAGLLDVSAKTTVNGALFISNGAASSHNSQPVAIGSTRESTVTVTNFVNGQAARMVDISTLTAGEAAIGHLDIDLGGSVACANATFGIGAFGSTFISGFNQQPSELAVTEQLTVGQSAEGSLIMEDGAAVSANDLTIGAQMGGDGRVSVLGNSSAGPSFLSSSQNLIVGLEGKGFLRITEGAVVTCLGAAVGVLAGADGLVSLGVDNAPGDPARWVVNSQLVLGGLAPGIVVLHNSSTVSVGDTLFIEPNGSIGGTGTYSAQMVVNGSSGGSSPALPEADLNGGTVTPGNPVGTLIIDGDYEQTATGKLTIEATGLGDGEFDVLNVTGDATLGGTLEILFPGAYLPKAGDSFQFLQVDGTINGDFAAVTFPQLLPGFQFDMMQVPGGMVFTAKSDAVLAPTFLLNISTRLQVGTDDNVLIGGFILQGTEPKTVLIRAIGPSLEPLGVVGALADPTLELHDGTGALIGQNDNWQTTRIGGVITDDQYLAIHATAIQPTSDAESAIIATLDPGLYTAIIAGADDSTGVGLAEVYDLGPAPAPAKLANISTRGFVQTGDDVMIGGFIIGNQTSEVLVRGIGPSLTAQGVNGALADPMLELFDINGALLASNDNWRSDQEAEIEATTIPPNDDLEAAILRSLAPGAYTAILRGVADTTGVGLVETYNLD